MRTPSFCRFPGGQLVLFVLPYCEVAGLLPFQFLERKSTGFSKASSSSVASYQMQPVRAE